MSIQKAKPAHICEHMVLPSATRGMFAKRTFKSALSGKQVIDIAEQCFICHVIHPFWRTHVKSSEIAVAHQATSTTEISRESKPYKADLALKEDEVGEAYHVLVCRLLLKWNGTHQLRKFPITIHSTKVKEESEIAALFNWYQIPFYFEKHDTKKQVEKAVARCTSKEVATDEIGSFFARSDATPTDDTSTWPDQAAVFNCVRAMLDPIFGTTSVRGQNLATKYFRPSYAAKYWVNRFLRLTNQDKLPQKKDVRNVAVIHYRHEAKSMIGFDMAPHLEYVAKAIRGANLRATLAGGMTFSHVILYGDFVSRKGRELREVIEEILVQRHLEMGDQMKEAEDIKVLFISRPWLPRTQPGEEVVEEEGDVRELWAAFRRIKVDEFAPPNDPRPFESGTDAVGSDPLPLQVKILAIWTMLCKRYSPNICVIGQRSGFIEGAAFTGIPVFYFNIKRPEDYTKPCDTLWRLVKGKNGPHDLSRLQKIDNVINTLIPIYVLKEISKEKKIRVEKYEPELMVALFTFMCCNSTERSEPSWGPLSSCHLPAWTVKANMMNDECDHEVSKCGDITDLDGALRYLESMIHESEPQERQPSDQRSCEIASDWALRQAKRATEGYRCNRADPVSRRMLRKVFRKEWGRKQCQTGQEWLRRRCNFAVNVPVQETGEPELDVSLQPWTDLRQVIDERIVSKHENRFLEAMDLMWKKTGPQILIPTHLPYDPYSSTISCIQEMSLVLCCNIRGLKKSKSGSRTLRSYPGTGQDVSNDVYYACLYWTTHFSIEKITDPWIVEQFLRRHFLHWVELMILMWRLSDVQPMLANLQEALRGSPFLSNDPMFGSDGLTTLEVVKRARLFVKKNFQGLFRCPLEVYAVGNPDERSIFGRGSPSRLAGISGTTALISRRLMMS